MIASESLRPAGTLDMNGLRCWVREQLPARLAQGRRVVLLILDVDDLRALYRRFGERRSDEILSKWVHLVRTSLQPTDLVTRVRHDQLALVLDRDRLPDVESLLCTLRRAVREGLSDRELEFSAGFVRWKASMELEPALLLAERRMLEARQYWRAMFQPVQPLLH